MMVALKVCFYTFNFIPNLPIGSSYENMVERHTGIYCDNAFASKVAWFWPFGGLVFAQ